MSMDPLSIGIGIRLCTAIVLYQGQAIDRPESRGRNPIEPKGAQTPLAPKHYIDPCTLLQAQLTSCTNTVGQVAAIEALTYELECMEKDKRRITDVMKNLDTKRRYIVKRLTAMPNEKRCSRRTRACRLAGVDDFCEHLLIAVVPGSECGDEFGMRIFAHS
ncbi:unnamed protein product [Peronospora belbahrii]|uniref:Uncharacterized protein n=1 Tax=Peronospora belbahrii TaxID=622444 RepID=A0AAU9L7N2_9STRA|nr:unnamed protein product [Peronospora belbahrii]